MSTVPAEAAPRTTTIAALKPPATDQMPEVAVGFTSLQAFTLLQRVATMFSNSSIVPRNFQNNIANCAIALEMSHRLGASPLMVMQNLYIVHGNPGWSAKFLIACFNQCGRFTSIKYRMVGTKGKDDWGCIATSTEIATGEKIEGPLIDIALAKAEGWYSKKDKNGKESSKWQTIPEQMLRYRAGAWMINTTAPEISMGLRTEDELHDTLDASRGEDGTFQVTTESLRAAAATIDAGAGDPPQKKAELITKEEALEKFKAAKTIGALEASWSVIVQNYQENGVDLPPDLEPACSDRRAAIEQEV
jgi:hypothetical protein